MSTHTTPATPARRRPSRPLPPLPNGHTYCTGPDGSRICTGAAMGRANTLPDAHERGTPCRLRLVAMREANRTCYDSGGAYWGNWSPTAGGMWRAEGDCGDTRARVFVRALTREQAKAKVREILSGARFYR